MILGAMGRHEWCTGCAKGGSEREDREFVAFQKGLDNWAGERRHSLHWGRVSLDGRCPRGEGGSFLWCNREGGGYEEAGKSLVVAWKGEVGMDDSVVHEIINLVLLLNLLSLVHGPQVCPYSPRPRDGRNKPIYIYSCIEIPPCDPESPVIQEPDCG